MGWNTLDVLRDRIRLLERPAARPKGRHAYFVHSYQLKPTNEADVLARADYGGAGHRDRRHATTSSARNFTPRRARSSGWR